LNEQEVDVSPAPARAEDAHARFLSLFLGSEREIFRYISAIVPSVSDAQDLVQQTALALWRKFDLYDPALPFTPWACRFALMEVKAFLRRQGKWRAMLEGDLADVLAQRREQMAGELDRRFAHLGKCLGKLPTEQRTLVTGYYYDRRPVGALATAAGRTAEAVYKSLQRIRRALFECVTASMHAEEASA
jgi:RNA polymerase sigma-70 factor (ECF subfamily)